MAATDDQPQLTTSSPEYVPLEEAALLFEAAGVFRSLRTLSRYCQHGVLDNLKEETPSGAMRYLVTRESVQNRIAEMRQLGMSGYVQPRPDMSGHDATRLDTSSHDETVAKEMQEQLQAAERERDVLRDENMQLKIDVASRRELLRMAKEDRDAMLTDRDTMQRMIGGLETQLRQLQAPKSNRVGEAEVDNGAPGANTALQ
jgi:hypothetical protein